MSSYVVPLADVFRMIVVMGVAAAVAGGTLGAAIAYASSRRTASAVRSLLAERIVTARSPRDVLASSGPVTGGIPVQVRPTHRRVRRS